MTTPASSLPPEATTVYLVRHGETDYNRDRIVQGRGVDSDLNEVGRAQARALAARLQTLGLDALYTSSLKRAWQTAAPLLDVAAPPHVERLADLDEMSFGVYEGRPFLDDVADRLQALRNAWRNGLLTERAEGGESAAEVQLRGRRALAFIAERHPGQSVAAITHGRMLRLLLTSVVDDLSLVMMDEQPYPNTGVTHLTVRPDSSDVYVLRLHHLADLSHLMSSVERHG